MTTEPAIADPVASAHRIIQELRRGRDGFAPQVAGFSDDDLARQSACTDWDVSQVLSHLGSGAEIALATVESALAGRDPAGQEANQQIWDRWNAMSRGERAAGWTEWTDRYQAGIEALDDDTLAALRVQFSFFPAPVDAAALLGMRLNEQALHQWDVASSFDAGATIPDTEAELLIDRVPGMMRWAGHADRWSGEEARIAVTTTAPARTWTLRIGDVVEIDDSHADGPIHVTLPAETFIRLTSGRFRDPDASRVRVDGPLSLTDVVAVFPGF
jgi:uncharacterized protein (TIGR03083 family)